MSPTICFSACPWYLSMLLVLAVCPCWCPCRMPVFPIPVSRLYVHSAWTCYANMNRNMQFSFYIRTRYQKWYFSVFIVIFVYFCWSSEITCYSPKLHNIFTIEILHNFCKIIRSKFRKIWWTSADFGSGFAKFRISRNWVPKFHCPPTFYANSTTAAENLSVNAL
jgi:hypothetical protein